MSMKTVTLSISDPQAISHAISVIQAGGLVAFPTDTVYGVAAQPFSAGGIERLFEVKERDLVKAIPVLVGTYSQLDLVAADLPAQAVRLAELFWPGALTLIVPRHPSLPEIISPTLTIGVRMPDHPYLLRLLKQSGPLATTSANISGGLNPLTAQDVISQLDGRIELVLDGGRCPGGIPSTLVDCTKAELAVLRQGPITLEEMLNRLGRPKKPIS